MIAFLLVASTTLFGQNPKPKVDSSMVLISIETDPAFWIGTLPNGLGFDANIDFRLAKHPSPRFGILGYSGKWSGEFGKAILLTKDFIEDNWGTP